MNTNLGYSKRTLTNTDVLLSGGGNKPLSDFVGSISWDAENRLLKYTPIGGTATEIVTLSSLAITNYVLTKPTTSALGGIIASNVLETGVTLTSGDGDTTDRYYGVLVDNIGKAFVNIPYFAIENLTDWAATTLTTASNISFTKVWWKIAPTSSNKVYGIGIHPTNGLLYYIYNNKGTYAATAYSKDSNTWRAIYVNGDLTVGTGTGTKYINYAAGDNITITYEAAGTGLGQSESSDYFNIKIAATNTWNAFTAATLNAAGTAGYIQAPAGALNKYFRGDNSWLDIVLNVTTSLYFGASNGTSNALVSTDPYIILKEGTDYTRYKFEGAGGITIGSDSNGNLKFTGTTYSVFTGASDSADGAAGLVKKPVIGDESKFLRGDCEWATIPQGATYSLYVGGASDTSTVELNTNGNVHLIFTDGTNTTRYKILGTGRASVTSSNNGTIYITSSAYSNFTSATASAPGESGLVPGPGPNILGDKGFFLRADGLWRIPIGTWKEVSTSLEGYVPKIVTTGTLTSSDTPFILVYKNTSGVTKSAWAPLPANAFNDTWTAMTGATSTDNGTVGYVNAIPPSDGYNTKFLRADGTWSVPDYPTKDSWNYDDCYVTSVGVTDDSENHPNLLRYVKNSVSTYFTVPYATLANTITVTDKSTHESLVTLYNIPMISAISGNASVYGSSDFYAYRSSNSLYINIGSSDITSGITFHNIGEATGKYGNLVSAACTDLRTWTLPDSTGIIALTSQLPTVNDNKFSIKSKIGNNTATTLSDFTANQNSDDDFTLILGDNITFTNDTTNRTLEISSSYVDTKYYLTLNGSTKGDSGGTDLGTFYAIATSDASAADQVWMRNSNNTAYAWRTLGTNAFNSTDFLPLSGGTITSTQRLMFELNLTGTGALGPYIAFKINNTNVGYIGYKTDSGMFIQSVSPNKSLNITTNGTLEFGGNTVLDTNNSYVSSGVGYINGTAITSIESADRLAGLNILNANTANTYILLATINITGTSLKCAGFAALFTNREILSNDTFLLLLAIRRTSTSSIQVGFYYTPLSANNPKNIYVRSNNGKVFYVYMETVANDYSCYYGLTKLYVDDTQGTITFSNEGTTSPITGSKLNVQAVSGGFVTLSTDQTISGKKTLSNDILFNNAKSINFKDTSSTECSVLTLNSSNNIVMGLGAKTTSNTYITGNTVHLVSGGSGSGVYINSSNNIGIGTLSPSYKLHVSGTGYVSDELYLGKSLNLNTGYYVKFKIGNDYTSALGIWSSLSVLNLGYYTALNKSYYTNIYGNEVRMYGGTSSDPDLALCVSSTSNVGIGTYSPGYKLHVAGTGYVSGNFTAGALIKYGGTSSLFLMADGSVLAKTDLPLINHALYSMLGSNGSAGYVKICEITIGGKYKNSPIDICLCRRGDSTITHLSIRFTNVDGYDPALSSFTTDSSLTAAWMYKVTTSKWALYIQKAEDYDQIDILDYVIPLYMAGVTIAWRNIHNSSIPSGAVQADAGGYVTATNAVTTSPGVDVTPTTKHGYWAAMTTLSGISTDWWHILHMDWTGSAAWRSELALPTLGRTGVYYRSDVLSGSTWSFGSWIGLLDTSSTALTKSGNLTCANFYSSSDISKKTNFLEIPDRELKYIQFDWKKSGKRSYGLIALEVNSIYPELVDGEDGNMTVNYNAALCLSVGQLLRKVKLLEQRVMELELKLWQT